MPSNTQGEHLQNFWFYLGSRSVVMLTGQEGAPLRGLENHSCLDIKESFYST